MSDNCIRKEPKIKKINAALHACIRNAGLRSGSYVGEENEMGHTGRNTNIKSALMTRTLGSRAQGGLVVFYIIFGVATYSPSVFPSKILSIGVWKRSHIKLDTFRPADIISPMTQVQQITIISIITASPGA